MERVLIGDLTVDGAILDMVGPTINIGVDYPGGVTRTDATTKAGFITSPHYLNAEDDFVLIHGYSHDGINMVVIGGNSSVFNVPTLIGFTVAASATSISGTTIAYMDIDGFYTNTIRELTPDVGVTINNEVYMPDLVGTGTGTSMVYYNRATGELTYGDAPVGTSNVSVTNQGDNRVVTSTAVTDVLNAEEYMTFDGNLNIFNGGGLDQYGRDLKIGGDVGAWTSRTDAITKSGGILGPHYTNAEEDVGVISYTSQSTANIVAIGSISSLENGVTEIWFNTVANNTTVGINTVATMDINGFHVDTIGELTAAAGVTINDEVYLPTIGGSGTGTSIIYFNRATGELTYGDAVPLYTHPNHTGQIDSVADGATSANSTLVSAQTNMTSVSVADEFLMLNASIGDLGRATVGELQTYMQANLTFGGVDYGADNQIPFMNSTTDFNYDPNLTWNGDRLFLGSATGDYAYVSHSETYSFNSIRDGNCMIALRNVSNTVANASWIYAIRYGGSIGSAAAAPSDAIVMQYQYDVYDGSSVYPGGWYKFRVDGAVATGNFDTLHEWATKDGASALALTLTLGKNGLEYDIDHSTAQAANNRWIVDKEYVDNLIIGGVSFGDTDQIPHMNTGTPGTDFDYSPNFTFGSNLLTVVGTIRAQSTAVSPTSYVTMTSSQFNMFISSTQRVLFYPDVSDGASAVAFTMGTDNALTTAGAKLFLLQNNAVEKFFVDKDGNVDIELGAEYRVNGVPIGGTNYWDRSGTDLSPVNPGDDILLATTTERIVFGDFDTWIYESADDEISIVVGATTELKIGVDFTTSANHFIPVTNKAYDLGSSSASYWQDLFIERVVVASTDTIIARDGSGNMTFVDGITSIKTLAELANAGTGNVSWGTETGLQPIVFGGSGGNIDSDGAFQWNNDTNSLIVNGSVSIYGSPINFTALSPDENELYVVAIDNSTGLLSKRSVASFSSASLTFMNGIYESLGVVQLGGTLVTNITFTSNSLYSVNFGIWEYPLDSFRVVADTGEVNLRAMTHETHSRGQLLLEIYRASLISIGLYDADIMRITLGDINGIEVLDARDSTGMMYADNYSPGATNRWITDKAYVDGVSDKRLKENLVLIEESVLPGLKTLNTYTFNLKKDPDKVRRYGLIAQEVIKVFPEAVHEMDEGFLSVRYKELVAVAVKGLNEVVVTQESQGQKIKRLTKRVLSLEKKLEISTN